MHFYKNKKNRIAGDRPQGVNIPGTPRRLIKVVSGDTLLFTANVVCPATREPVKQDNLRYTEIYIAVAENRFSPVLWSGSAKDGWIRLDEYRPGLIHVAIPRTVMCVLRRGSYAFSIVVDDGICRETQLVGNFQIEYEPTGAHHDIPYRDDQESGDPLFLTPELDAAAQRNSRLTHAQLVDAVSTISRTLIEDERIVALFTDSRNNLRYDEAEAAIRKLSQLILWDDELRSKIPRTPDTVQYNPTVSEFIDRVCLLLDKTGLRAQGNSNESV